MANKVKKKSKTQKAKAKERKALVRTQDVSENADGAIVSEETSVPEEKKTETKPVKKEKKKSSGQKNIFSRFIDYVKGTYQELKKVNWLSREDLLKSTGFVFGFVAVFTLIVWVIDSGLGALAAVFLNMKS